MSDSGDLGALLGSEAFGTLAAEIMNGVVRGQGGAEDQAVALDPALTIDALLFIAAAIMEAGREVKTQRDMREAADAARTRLLQMLKGLRRQSEETGVHLLQHLASFTAPDAPPNPS